MSTAKTTKIRFNLRDKFGDWWEGTTRNQRVIFRIALIGFFFILPYLDNPILGTSESDFSSVLFYPMGMFAIMAIGLNIIVGKSGILDLGYVAFFAIGAYTHAILNLNFGFPFWINVFLGMGFAMLAGLMLGLPALRLRGDYLAIITLGFGEIIRIVALNLNVTGGAAGLAGIPAPPSIFGVEFLVDDPKPFYWLVLTMTLLVVWAYLRLTSRRPGRAWEAIREDEDVAELMGVPTFKYKLWGFVMGGAVGGVAGALYSAQVTSIVPELFTLNVSIMILACVVFGGMGNIWGVAFGAALLGYLPEKLRFLSDTRILIFGLLMVVMMNVRPDGLIPRKKREKIYDKDTGASISR
jgi:branched-chain amino acid transport system permease protein